MSPIVEDISQDRTGENRFRESRSRSGPAVKNRTCKMPPGPSLWDDLVHFTTLMMPTTSNEMRDNLTEVSIGWISEFGRNLLLRSKDKYALTASATYTGDSARVPLTMWMSGMAEELGNEVALKIWQVPLTRSGNTGANVSRLLNLGSDSLVSPC